MHLPSVRLIAARLWFALSLIALALFRLSLVHNEEIAGSATEYDALWYVTSAKYWYWNTPYSWSAFVRPPAYPLWLAVVHAVHIPQRLAIELLQLSGWLLLVVMFRRIGIPRWLCLISFAALSLQPASFLYFDFTMSDNFYAALLSFLLAGFIGMTFGPFRIGMSILSGVTLAALWLARDESVLLLLVSAIWLLLSLVFLRKEFAVWRETWVRIRKPAATFALVAAVLISSAYAVSLRTFGAFAKSDTASRSFQSLIHALLRIKPTETPRFVSMPMENFRRAFEISPTFAQLKPELEGATGEAWRIETRNRVGAKNEIGIGWMMWAIRQAASRVGVHDTPSKAASFYKQAAGEIERACNEKRVPTRFVVGGYLDPLTLNGWRFLPKSFARVARVFVARYGVGPFRDDPILRPEQKQIYDEITLRRGDRTEGNSGLATNLEAFIGRNYRFFVWALLDFGVASLIVLSVRSTTTQPAVNFVILLLAATIASRVTLFAVLDATAFAGDDQRFLIPVMPLFSVMLLLIIYQAATALLPKRSQVA
jgi:hypothetical protein